MGLKASERMFLQKLKRLSWGRSRWRALIGVLGAVVTGAIYWYAAYHNHNIGAFTRFTSAANSFSTNLTQLLSSTGTISSGAQTARRAAKFLNIKPSTGSEVAPSDGRNARIEVRGLTVEFPSQKEGETKVRALDDLNLVIEPGEKVALMGKNGSGKSTIVDLLLGNNRDYIVGGSLYINGTEVRNWALIHLNDMQAICKQEVTTFPLTTAENVAFWGGKNVDLDLVRQVAQEIGFDLEEEGIDLETLLREDASGRNLSGGQAQKVSVLRALYHYYANRKVSLLIADECTSAIYSSDADRIYECMLSLEGTVILVTHAPHLAKIVGMHPQGRIIILNKGRIVEDGNHAMLVAARHEYYQLLKGGGIL
jgi:ABC-type multidrug transport system fused ATPase/permease subunit